MSENYRLRESDDYKVYFISHANTRVGGSVDIDEDGFASIYINARRSADQQLKTFKHELRHLAHDDAHSDDPIEVVEARAAASEIIPQRPEPDQAPPPAEKPRPSRLEISHTLKQDAAAAFGIPESDPQWNEIIWAMMLTGSRLSSDDPRRSTQYHFDGALVYRGGIYKSNRRTTAEYRRKRRYDLGFNWWYQ